MQVNIFGCAGGSWIGTGDEVALGDQMQCCWSEWASGLQFGFGANWMCNYYDLRASSIFAFLLWICWKIFNFLLLWAAASRYSLIHFAATLMVSVVDWYSLTRLIPADLIWYTLNSVNDLLLSSNRILWHAWAIFGLFRRAVGSATRRFLEDSSKRPISRCIGNCLCFLIWSSEMRLFFLREAFSAFLAADVSMASAVRRMTSTVGPWYSATWWGTG